MNVFAQDIELFCFTVLTIFVHRTLKRILAIVRTMLNWM